MIQFKKIPLGKSALLYLLFLTTNISGFLQDYQSENEITRKSQNLFSMDLQQPDTRNMPIRRTGIDRVINEKDGNSERLYDRRSFRTGTIQRPQNTNSRRSIERSSTDVRDINNNRQRFSSVSQEFQYTRNSRRSVDSATSRDNRRSVEDIRDRLFGERSSTSANRRSVDRTERSSEIRVQRNLENTKRRIDDRRIKTATRSTDTQRKIQKNSDDRREIINQYSRRTARRELSQGQPNSRVYDERLTSRQFTRLNENRISPELARRSLEIRRFVRSAEVRTRMTSDEYNLPERRTTQPLERRNSKENLLETRTIRNQDNRISERRHVERRQLPSTERLQRISRKNQDRRTSQQRRLSSRTHNRLTERSERHSRVNLLESRTVESPDHRTFENGNEDRRQLSSEVRFADRTLRSTLPLQRNSRDNSIQRRTVEIRERRVSERLSSERENSAERMYRIDNILEIRNVETRDLRTSQNRNIDRSRSRDSRINSVRDIRERLSKRSLERRDSNEPRAVRVDRMRDQTREETQVLSRRLPEARDFSVESAERRDGRLSDTRERSTERLQRIISKDNLRVSSQRRDRVDDRQTTVDNRRISREHRILNNREVSRSDSTRYIQDNTYFRDARLANKQDSARSFPVTRMENKNSIRENLQIAGSKSAFPLDSRRFYERIVSQSEKVRNTKIPVLNLENNAYAWANTAKIILAVFLLGQILVNSSKAKKFRFDNILSMATAIKEKIH